MLFRDREPPVFKHAQLTLWARVTYFFLFSRGFVTCVIWHGELDFSHAEHRPPTGLTLKSHFLFFRRHMSQA